MEGFYYIGIRNVLRDYPNRSFPHDLEVGPVQIYPCSSYETAADFLKQRWWLRPKHVQTVFIRSDIKVGTL